MFKKKKILIKDLTTDEIIERILSKYDSVEIREHENGIMEQFMILVDKKEMCLGTSIRLALEETHEWLFPNGF